MKALIRIIILALLIPLVWACRHDDGFDKDLPGRIGGPYLVIKGEVLFSFDSSTCQESYIPGQRLYRAGTDTMSDYFTVRMSREPSEEGQEVTCSITWTDIDKESVMDRLSFKVQDIDNDLIWLWCHRQKITMAVRILY